MNTPLDGSSTTQSKLLSDQVVREIPVTLGGHSTRVFVGGQGSEHLLLIHGGWGSARMHWSSVWNDLAKHFRVVAPDLPGFGAEDREPLASVEAYSKWLRALLETLDVPRVWCVGNSFGASVAWRFASDYPDVCAGLVLVNGFAMPRSPRVLQWLGGRRLGHRIVRFVERKVAYTEEALKRGFVDTARAPEELRTLLATAAPPGLDVMANVLVRGDASAPPRFAPLLLWGKDDHLPGSSAQAARKLQASLPGSTLVFVEKAGHMPQVENPAAFVEALRTFVDATESRTRPEP